MKFSALLSDDELYRFLLTREWEPGKRSLVSIGLNPSTADAKIDDPTIKKEVKFARAWGCGSLIKVNLFAWRSTDPSVLPGLSDPVGKDNDCYILEATRKRHAEAPLPMILCAWGNGGELHERGLKVTRMLSGMGRELLCLTKNKNGEPAHPLYQRDDSKPIPYTR